jgi:acetyl esterase/lipase
MWNESSYTVKVIDNCHIQADVYRLEDGQTQPVIVWIHGGALIFGNRTSIARYQLKTYLEAGFTVVAIDYRLAPETKLPAIIEDLVDAIQWVREKGPDLFRVDPNRLAVIGHSAGGYLTLMSGACARPAPQALVSFYGYGDIIGSWYSQPDAYYCQQGMVTRQRAYASIGQIPISETMDPNRFIFYQYCRQHGLWPLMVAGENPHKNPGWFSRYCPIQHVTESYPPTLLIHGDQDMDVPHEQSVGMEAILTQQHVPHQFLSLPGRGHGFDDAEDDAVVNWVFEEVVRFLRNYC